MSAAGVMGVGLVVACKGRLAFLSQAMPTWRALPLAEIVVVDVECPDGAGDWAEGLGDERIRVVRMTNVPKFNLSQARNRGIEAARAEWLVLIDSDILLASEFSAVMGGVVGGSVYRCSPMLPSLGGTLLVERQHLVTVGGYDEVYENWGDEDADLMRRLEFAGVRAEGFASSLVQHIPHDDTVRTRFHATQDIGTSAITNYLYGTIKIAAIRQLGTDLPLDVRRALYVRAGELARSVLASQKPADISLTVGSVPIGPYSLQTSVQVRLSPTPRPANGS